MAYISFQPTDFFNPLLYTGTGASNAQTGVGFQPDFTWIKNRDTSDFHVLTDAVRGVTKYVQSNSTAASVTNVESLKTFDSDGFTVGTMNEVNTNTEDYVSWNWKAGTTTGIGSGDITPTAYSFNTTSGFSMVAYTGTLSGSGIATVPHGLGIAPKMVITKSLSDVRVWYVQHIDLTTPSYKLNLDSTAAQADGSGNGVMSSPTTIVFDTNWGSGLNESGQTYIAYCFAEVKGFSKISSWLGNGNADGTFVYTGFRPAFILFKAIATAENWNIYDDKRLGYNVDNDGLNPNTTGTGYTTVDMDIVSNGFKMRTTNSRLNGSGATFIYAAFAKFPIVSSNDVSTVAR